MKYIYNIYEKREAGDALTISIAHAFTSYKAAFEWLTEAAKRSNKFRKEEEPELNADSFMTIEEYDRTEKGGCFQTLAEVREVFSLRNTQSGYPEVFHYDIRRFVVRTRIAK